MERVTQVSRIMEHLRKYGSITQLEAADKYGIMRLGARIWELRDAGNVISSTLETSLNRYGNKVTYSRYALIKEAQNAL